MKIGKFNTNWIAVGLLVGAFVVSAVRFYFVSQSLGNDDDPNADKVIRVTHWQLEPGFREALQWAIDEYNNLPEVKEAGVRVEQLPISERVYNQFMNIHLISGTAPDIAVKKNSELIKGNALAKFYTPLGSYVEEPNPYNAPEYQIEGISDKLSNYLATTPWKETFFDGLQGGYEFALSDYYAIPISTWGGARLIYNLTLLKEGKAFALEEALKDPQPEWLTKLWRTDSNPDGILPEDSAIAWLKNDSTPTTLGELYLYCATINEYKVKIGDDKLVPIAASSYGGNNVIGLYTSEFLAAKWRELDLELGSKMDNLEALAGYTLGTWNFDSTFLREYFKFSREMTQFYPQGYLGLDREQAQRRFVLGKAAILATGGWDVKSIYLGIEARENPNDRFKFAITPEPLPAADERWAEFIPMRVSEADTKGAVPFAVNKQSKNFDWAMDFLKFISSHRINEQFNERAGWLPVINYTKLPEEVKEFAPMSEGLPKNFSIDLWATNLPGAIRNTWSSQVKLFESGDTSYDEMAVKVEEVLNNNVIGIDKAWKIRLLAAQDSSLANGRAMSVERLGSMLGSEKAGARERSNTYLNLVTDDGVQLRRWWEVVHPGEPYPEYE